MNIGVSRFHFSYSLFPLNSLSYFCSLSGTPDT